jgi:predicted amidohydrolase YtcJ
MAAFAGGFLLGAAACNHTSPRRGRSSTATAQRNAPADFVLAHGDVYTVDCARPRAQAIAIRRGKIVAVGSNDEMRRWTGPQTRVINLHGRFAMPGFNDAHTHLASAGAELLDTSPEMTIAGGRVVDQRH